MSNIHTPILACDIGGTHITSAIVSSSDWKILSDTQVRKHVDSSSDAKSIFQSWAENILHCIERYKHSYKEHAEINRIGIAMPGPFDYEKGISLMKNQDKYDSLYQLEVSEGIKEALNNQPIEIKYINDAAAFLQGEIFSQQIQHEQKVLGITLGTGLGSAVWSKGSKAFDADLWKVKYQDSIFEEYLVTRWFTSRFKELSGHQEKGLKEIIENHSNSEAFQKLISEYRIHLKNFLDYFKQEHDASHFIIGGNIAKAWNIIGQQNSFSDYKITLARYAEKAALVGAASIY